MSRVPVRRRLSPADRREELLDAAEAVIRRLGDTARVEDIVREAGAGRGTFYVYFETWEALLHALRERVFAQLDQRFSAWANSARDWRDLVSGLPELFVDMTLGMEGLHQALLHGPVGPPPRRTRHDVIHRLADLITQGVTAGAFAVVDPKMTAVLVFAVLHETADQVERGASRKATLAAAQDLLIRALEATNRAG
uniref:TetR/AcrR family transcriptional regulator n=1 Tax=Phenylobacterium glaciei TaxID=2803784 RepID=A0A974P385_9CAUL|nr:TetR/AcrR family transcriptional regulator [Phenylobacterium glaciei]